MTEHFGDDYHTGSVEQRERGGAVPEIVKTHRGEFRLFEQRAEVASEEVRAVHESAGRRSENVRRVMVLYIAISARSRSAAVASAPSSMER
jgi:hypothetical protein